MSENVNPEATTAPGGPKKLLVSSSPHVRADMKTSTIMLWVVVALLPGVAVSLYFFGLSALQTYVVAIVSCIAVEAGSMKLLKTPGSIRDYSALLTGVLLAMNLPPTAPWWLVVVGAVIAMFVAKHLFGGLGANIFNPALTARVFLLVSWPVHMTTWLQPGVRGFVDKAALALTGTSAITGATPLGLVKEGGLDKISTSATDMFFGNMGGSLGEISALAILAGGLVLLARRIITWEIPVTMIGSVVLVTGLARLIGGPQYGDPLFHVLTGGLMLGAFFMATDMVTSPISFKGRVVFGMGAGLLTAVIRLWGGYPEGVSFAILIMNATTPLIDNYLRPKTFGSATAAAAKGAK